MADLDDFFAKKDRKKSKSKKFATADEIAKKLEETGKRNDKIKKEKNQLSQNAVQEVEDPGNPILKDEDEWKDFEEEKKDYSGLKIQNLKIGENEGEEERGEVGDADEEGGMEENEAGELVPRRRVQAGPWKVVQQSGPGQAPTEESQMSVIPEEKVQPPAPVVTSGSRYIPPSLRNQPSHPSGPRGMKMKGAPDVSSEEMFPTLSAAKSQEPVGAWGKKKRDEGVGFEEVRNSKSHSSRYTESTSRTSGPDKLSLDNKFDALTDQS